MNVGTKMKLSSRKERVIIHTHRTSGVSKISRDGLEAAPMLSFAGIRLISALMPKQFKPTQCLSSAGIRVAHDIAALVTIYVGG